MPFPTISVLNGSGSPVTVNTLPNAGQATAANSLPVVLASDDPLVTAIGSQADAAATTDTGTFSLIAFVKRGLSNWTTLLARIPALVSGRIPVDGSGVTQPVSDAGGSLTVDGTVELGPTALAALETITVASVTAPLAAGTNEIGTVRIRDISNGDYETVAASQTTQALGATGAAGDYLAGLLIVPATTSPGAVAIKDGSNSAITVFAGGTDSVSNLVPFFVPLGIVSTAGAWQVTTGSNVSIVASGNFT